LKAKPAPPEWTRVGYLISRARVPRSSSRRLTHTGPDCDSSLVGSVTPSPKFSIYKGLLEVYSRLPTLRGTASREGASPKVIGQPLGPRPSKPHAPSGFFRGGRTGSDGCIFLLNKFLQELVRSESAPRIRQRPRGPMYPALSQPQRSLGFKAAGQGRE